MRTPLWLVPNLLSLDAPIVAVLWQAITAASFQLPIRPAARIILFLTVWAIYLLDRLLDTRPGQPLRHTRRHAFHRRHRKPIWILVTILAAADGVLCLFELRWQVFLWGLPALAAVALYFFFIQSRTRHLPLPKEPVTALLFSFGTMLAPLALSTRRSELLTPFCLFFLLCLTNLAQIEMWERSSALPSPVTQAAAHLSRYGIWLLALPGLLPAATPFHRAASLSAILFGVLITQGSRLSIDARRTLADAALLTPILWLF